jgi:hypothetical protein
LTILYTVDATRPTPATPDSALSGSNPAAKGSDLDPRTELSLNEQVGHYIEMWKKAVEVQQHFNDIEWRIRGLALTVATFALGAAGVAAKDGTKVGWLSLGSLVTLIGLLLWYAFYFVDRSWYHPLLKAAVAHGTIIEDEIKKSLPQAGMTATITARSPQQMGKISRTVSRKETMHSDDKLAWFYQIGASAFVVAAVALQIGVLIGTGGPMSQRIEVLLDQPTPVNGRPGPLPTGSSPLPPPTLGRVVGTSSPMPCQISSTPSLQSPGLHSSCSPSGTANPSVIVKVSLP